MRKLLRLAELVEIMLLDDRTRKIILQYIHKEVQDKGVLGHVVNQREQNAVMVTKV